jgi:hypothetical protein
MITPAWTVSRDGTEVAATRARVTALAAEVNVVSTSFDAAASQPAP